MNAQQSRDWLRRRLRNHGQDGKTLKTSFPFDAHEQACGRAKQKGRAVPPGQKGTNPSSSMPALIERIRENP
ncbi:hypothetical protein [Actinoplanes sp. NPDC048796]|uniref:hypothetical protein n=1 Tax=Actinoplanes sp. NPDC048796 TaxID=3155640 RepID=UPI0033D4BC01